MTTLSSSTCMAPVDDGNDVEHEELCGKPAVTERVLEDVAIPLCQEHADEVDAEAPPDPEASRANLRSLLD